MIIHMSITLYNDYAHVYHSVHVFFSLETLDVELKDGEITQKVHTSWDDCITQVINSVDNIFKTKLFSSIDHFLRTNIVSSIDHVLVKKESVPLIMF